ncbi:nucleotide pyrophosphohydrolase [Brachybacterium ginsengisoli]|uniref:Nucleotide pyrophosphohydrolase n=1 Tax=Brachybacterium ginsengisoli TaxID=1331682 RepID=A0A291H0B6_9MICO|nr:nucleotide pyrophosphohydrolase [Brachybacterium ginsengisoli]ATG55832.1 nucleotide pyrophosphohydrolase [Brachybacterium ginsengisoli]
MASEPLLQTLRTFMAERDWEQFHSPENLAKSISIEAAELLECYQWNGDGDQDEVAGELADVLTYALLLADKLELDPEQIIRTKLERTGQKYPVEKAKGRSTKYDRL